MRYNYLTEHVLVAISLLAHGYLIAAQHLPQR